MIASGHRSTRYRDRLEAGRAVAAHLRHLAPLHPLVLGIPRGGVPVAAAVADALGCPLDIVVARKLGAPGSPELAIGAVTASGGRFLNEDVLAALAVSDEYLAGETARELEAARAREERLRVGRPALDCRGRCVILCDDGLATGATMRAAARALRQQRVGRLVIAVPVGARESCAALEAEADEFICPWRPEPFGSVGAYYADFAPVPDEQVVRLLHASARLTGLPGEAPPGPVPP